MFFHKKAGVSWLVVFLGNPGAQYDRTRHNAGFMAADAFAAKHNLRIDRAKYNALIATCTIGEESVMLMKPQTYMNSSGEAAVQAAHFYKIPPEHVIVVSDEISLPAGALRIRAKGSAGGHNGLKSIIACLGSDQFPRIRLGVGSPSHPEYEMVDWVLGRFAGDDAKRMEEAAALAADAVEYYILHGPDQTMSRYNRK